MKTPLVSVIIPTFNRAALVCRAIENVFAQTYRNLDVIVVDDGSTDDTQLRLRQFRSRIRVIAQANAGPSVARNRGIEVARGEIIAFQDSDDLWMPTKLERQVALLQDAPSNVPCCLCNANMNFVGRPSTTSFELAGLRPPFDEGLWTNVPDVLVTTFILFNQCVAIRSEALRRIGGFDESLKYCMEDYALALRLSLAGGSWAFVREPMVSWHQGSPESLSQKAMIEDICTKECTLKILEGILARVENEARYERLCGQVKYEVRRTRRNLATARMGVKKDFGASTASKFLKWVDHYQRSLYRRSPSFPRPVFQELQMERTVTGEQHRLFADNAV